MQILTWLTAALAAPVAVLGAPLAESNSDAAELLARQARRQQPPPCVRQNPPPTEEQLKVRFDTFVQAFVGPSSRKNITEAFTYIVNDYIVSLNRCPELMARN